MTERTIDIITRASKTALQSALAIIVASGTGYIDAGVWQAAAIAAGAAFISAIHNAFLNFEEDPNITDF